MLKKGITFVLLVIIIVSSFTGCVGQGLGLPGEDLIYELRDEYIALESGKLIVTNMQTDTVDQEFTFTTDEEGNMTFLFEGVNIDGETDYHYGNRTESVLLMNGELTELKEGDETFTYYTSQIRHPNATGNVVLYFPEYMLNMEEKHTENEQVFVFYYDTYSMGLNALAYEVTFVFDNNDEFLYMIDKTIFQQEDGSEIEIEFKYEIKEMNAITSIEKPIFE